MDPNVLVSNSSTHSSPELNQSMTNNNDSQLNLSDFSCNICFEVLIEPIKLVCDHEICLPCFRSMIVNRNFLCPMCRRKIPLAYRKKRESNLRVFVDHRRWNEIKEAFPSEVDTRVNEEKLKKEEEKKNNQMIRRVIKRDGFNSINQYVNEWERRARAQARANRRSQMTKMDRFKKFIGSLWAMVKFIWMVSTVIFDRAKELVVQEIMVIRQVTREQIREEIQYVSKIVYDFFAILITCIFIIAFAFLCLYIYSFLK